MKQELADSNGIHNINISQYEKCLNDFANYAGNITQYVDSKAVKVSNTNFFSSVEFDYAEPKTNLEKAYSHFNGRSFGSYEYGKLSLMALRHTLLITTLFTVSFFMGLTLTDLIF